VKTKNYFDKGSQNVILSPSGLIVVAVTPNQVDLRWDFVDGAKEYKIYKDGKFLQSTPHIITTDTNVKPGSVYSYSISSVDKDGKEGDRCKAITARTLDLFQDNVQ